MSEADQCRALTESSGRCSRPAQDDGFCFQHDSNDETIGDADEHEDDDVSEQGEQQETERNAGEKTEGANKERDGHFGVMDVRETMEDVAADLVGHPLDGIIEITEKEDGWEVVVEIVERSSIPDTQDILGQYAVALNESGEVTGYRLGERYRRGDDRER
ncbi:gas vesicle protein GvpO, halophile-type [Haladaptatus halobius]|uniref:gas vesicle protein GvpO, halophile-type n=1 Tax=Haladaptatus halobius TaxID=2884875 RepID=UPI001D09C206|nr:gas vesicle protein GvpO [Haladaptatus halobius]